MDKWIGPYRLINFIEPGGSSAVFRAYRKDSEEEVAIKVMRDRFPKRDPTPKEKFLREVQILETLDHKHIVKLIEVIFEDTDYDQMIRPCIIMPYVPGGTLRKFLKNNNLLAFETIRSYMSQITAALAYAHSHKVVHCDVKPENILLSEDGSHLFLADFGIAQILSEIHSTTHVTTRPSGTDIYMAPEQFEGHPSSKSDQYALAILLYECLSGSPPFEGASYDQLSKQHRSTQVPSLRQKCRVHGRDISKGTELVILKALAKKKEKRYGSIQEFAEALDKALLLEIERSRAKPAINYSDVDLLGMLAGVVAGVIILFATLTFSFDVPQHFSQIQIVLSNGCEVLYGLFALTGLSCAVGWLVKRRSRIGVVAIGSFLFALIFYLLQYFFLRPLFTVAGQLTLWGVLILIPPGLGYLAGLLVAGVGRWVIWLTHRAQGSALP